MAAPSTCTVSGNLYAPDGSAINGAIISAYVIKPFFLGSNFIPAGMLAKTTSDSNGAWSLNLVRTGNAKTTVTVRIVYPNGDNDTQSTEYPIIVPETSTANFDALVDLTPFY